MDFDQGAKMASYTLGLDIGSNSIGWAIVQKDHGLNIKETGVNMFPEEGQAGKVSKGGKTVKVSQRAMRGFISRARKNRDRRSRRKEKLIHILTSNNMLPPEYNERDALLLDMDVIKKDRSLRPYRLRSKGLDKQLTLFEIGRVLFHLNQRRGYHSNRKSGDPSEDKKVGKEADALEKDVFGNDCWTLGEYLYKIISKREKTKNENEIERIRQRYTFRKTYLKEFNLLWEEQKKYYPNILTDPLKKQIQIETIYYQRPVKSPKPKRCEFEPHSYTCKKANWHARWYVLYQNVNNIKTEIIGREPKPLTEDQRKIALKFFSQNEKVKFSDLKKHIGLTKDVQLNYEEGGKNKQMKGDGFLADVRDIFRGDVWDNYDEDVQRKTINAFAYFNDPELVKYLKTRFNFDDKQIDKALKIPIPEGRMPYSMIALKKMNSYLQKGKLQYEALSLAYPEDDQTVIKPVGQVISVPETENHVVLKALYELKKTVNSIIAEYGKPGRIHIEMARDINKSPEERDRIKRKIKDAEDENAQRWDELKALITENQLNIRPDKKTLLKYKLWKEAKEKCVFCGVYIHPKNLFEPNIQIEHILPRSRSFDNSYANKTIAHSKCNYLKDKYTPYEVYNNRPEDYRQLLKWVYESDMSKQKINRFLQENLDETEALDRNLNDTRHANKAAFKMLRQIGCPISGIKAMFTSTIRELWDFNKILNPFANIKNRFDNRHHAIDAIIVALADEKLISNLKKHFENPHLHKFELPNGFWDQAKKYVEKINVSYRPSYVEGHHISDKYHQDNPLGPTKEVVKYFNEGNMKQISPRVWLCNEKLPYIKRKSLQDAIETIGDVESVIPESCQHIRDVIYQAAKEAGVNTNDKNENIPSQILGSIFLTDKDKNKIPVKKIRCVVYESNTVVFTDKDGKPYKAYPTGNNHHIEIIEYADGVRKGNIVTEIEAARRQAEGKPIIQKEHDAARFIMSLAQNDMFNVKLNNTMALHRIEKISSPDNIILRPHTYGGPCKDQDKKPLVLRVNPRTLMGFKVKVDSIGRVTQLSEFLNEHNSTEKNLEDNKGE